VNLQPGHLVGVSVVTAALWWTYTPIWEGGNTNIRGQTGHKAHNF